MAIPSISITLSNATKQISRLQGYKLSSESLEAKYQHFIAEMIMLRLFSIFEDSVAEIAYKLAAGAVYTNGSLPMLAIRAGRIIDSRGLFLNHGRVKPVQYLKWTKASYISDSVKYVIPTTEKFLVNASLNGSKIDEMRKVRNAVAHNTVSARSDYKIVVRATYGANVNIPVGAFLVSERRSPVCKINNYISSVRAILTAMASGV